MSKTQEMPLWNEGAESTDDFELDFKDQEMLDLGDKWLFPRASHRIETVLKPGVVRPLSPTLKVHAPEEDVFPGIAMLYEGFDDMQEWRNTIRFVGFFVRKGNMFDNRHHWNMRTKFLEIRVRCMEKILEDPFAKHRKPEGGFFVRIPVTVKNAAQKEGDVIAHQYERDNGTNDEHSNKLNSEMVESGDLGKANQQEYVGFAIHGQSCDVEITAGECFKLAGQDSEKKIDEDGDSTSPVIGVDGNGARGDKETIGNVAAKEENVCGEVENEEEGIRMQREIVRKELAMDENPEGQCRLPCPTSGHYYGRDECLRNLVVVGKAIEVIPSSAERVGEAENPILSEGSNLKNQLKELGSKSEAWSCAAQDELVLEDINDKDFVPDTIFSSSAKLNHTEIKNNTGVPTAVTSTAIEANGKLVERAAIQWQRGLSRFQRLRRRLGNLFSCFGKNKVTPVNIGLSSKVITPGLADTVDGTVGRS